MPNKVCCFGELLLRFTPDAQGQWLKNRQMGVFVGGAELNVAQALSKWNIPAKYCSALPDHEITHHILASLAQKNTDISSVLLTGERIGSYYLTGGTDIKTGGVIYDRAHSSFSLLKPGDIDWDKVFSNCNWFHFSAISPALNANAALVCKEAVEAAVKKGITISVDLNYRAKLWQYGVMPYLVMPEIVQHCHVIMGNMWAVEKLLGLPSPLESSIGKSKEELIEAAEQSILQVKKEYPKAHTLSYTFRLEKEYFGLLHHNNEMSSSGVHTIGKVIDKVGSGDCFMAALIYGLLHQHANEEIINYAAAAAVGKLYELGDATEQTVEQVLQKINYATTTN